MVQSRIKVLVISAVGAFALWACSTDAPAGSNIPPAGKSAEAADTAKPKTPTGAATSSAPSSAAPSGDTGATPTSPGSTPTSPEPSANTEACIAACAAKFPAGKTQSEDLNTKWDTCACQATVCGAQCGATDTCKEGGTEVKDGDACSVCQASAVVKTCDDQYTAACTGACADYDACIEPCGGGAQGAASAADGK
jgi:hypothetical protein